MWQNVNTLQLMKPYDTKKGKITYDIRDDTLTNIKIKKEKI